MQFPPEFPRDQYGLNIPELVPQTEENYPLDSLNLSTIPDKAPNITITNYRAITRRRHGATTNRSSTSRTTSPGCGGGTR